MKTKLYFSKFKVSGGQLYTDVFLHIVRVCYTFKLLKKLSKLSQIIIYNIHSCKHTNM